MAGAFLVCKKLSKFRYAHAGFFAVWAFTLIALTSASLEGAIFWFFSQRISSLPKRKVVTTYPYESMGGIRNFSHHEVHLRKRSTSCRVGPGSCASLCIERRRRARAEKHSRAQAFARPTRAVRHPRLSSVSAHRASVARVARRGFRPVLPGDISPSERRKPRHGKHPPGERARVSRASALIRRASRDGLAACVFSHFAGHAPADPDPSLPTAPVFAVSVPSRFRATQQVAKKNRDSLAPSSERAALAFVRSTVQVRASAPGYHPERVAGVSRARARSRGPPRAPFRARTPRAMKRKCARAFPARYRSPRTPFRTRRRSENARRDGPRASTRARERLAAADPPLPPSFTRPAARTLAGRTRRAHVTAGHGRPSKAEPRHRESRRLGIRKHARIFFFESAKTSAACISIKHGHQQAPTRG